MLILCLVELIIIQDIPEILQHIIDVTDFIYNMSPFANQIIHQNLTFY